MKLKCALCKQEDELTPEEIIETGRFVDENGLDISAYLGYISLKRGKKCAGVGGTDGKVEKMKKHSFIFSEDTDNELGKILGTYKDNIELLEKSQKLRDTTQSKIAKLEEELNSQKSVLKSTEEIIPSREDDVKQTSSRFKEMTGSGKIEVWK